MKKNFKIKILTSIITIISVCITVGFYQQDILAHNGYYTWKNDAKLTNGVGSYGSHVRYFWIDSSAAANTSQIDQVRNEWVNTSGTILRTSILIKKISVQKSSVFDIYKKQIYAHSTGIIGESYFYNSSNVDMGTPTYNYKWTKIILNTSVFNSLSSFNQRGTIAHELGHCLGLAHSTDSNRVMTQLGSGRKVAKATYTDLATINHLYN